MHSEVTAPDKMRPRTHLRLVASDGDKVMVATYPSDPNDDGGQAAELTPISDEPAEAAWIEEAIVEQGPLTIEEDESSTQTFEASPDHDELARAIEEIGRARDALEQDAACQALPILAVTYRRSSTYAPPFRHIHPAAMPGHFVGPKTGPSWVNSFFMTVVAVALLLLAAGIASNVR